MLGRTRLGSMRLAHLSVECEMIKLSRAMWVIRRKAEDRAVPREGRTVATKSCDPGRAYGYDVRTNRARIARVEQWSLRVSRIGWRRERWF